ncbi:MAG: patatin-like phospholipase family protein [Alphaproteobacteria bacterium]|nr:patatin-like phospholipase family protein [Alphaproteobacteria bacterium]
MGLGAMEEQSDVVSPRILGPLSYVPFLMRVPVLVGIVLVAILSDLAIPGSMREALRYSILDRPHQLLVIAVALVLACAAVRFTAEAIVELVSPELYDDPGSVGHTAHLLPRALALAIGVATGIPLLQLAFDSNALASPMARIIAILAGVAYILIGLVTGAMAKGPHTPSFATRKPTLLVRWGFALFPLVLAATFAGAVLGLWHEGSGTAYHALERYVSAFVGTVDDGSSPNGLLGSYVYDASGAPILRYIPYIKAAPFAASTLSPVIIFAELLSLLLSCIAARLSVAIFLDLILPGLGRGGLLARVMRRWLPPLASAGLGVALAVQVLSVYLRPAVPLPLSERELIWLWAIAAVYVALGLLASLGTGSAYVGDGPWRESQSVGRRFMGAARRLAALDRRWQWFVRGVILVGLALFLLFADLRHVDIPQWLGPVAIFLLWGATASALFFPLAYLSHMTRVPMLTILIIAGATFAGFDLNDNHELRVVPNSPNAASGATPSQQVVQTDRRKVLDFASWIASRADWNQYAHYPVFLVATEGGGIRAAYFTTTVLAALQERCPAFAQHTLAISGVSGGSLGAAIFAALAADHARNVADSICNIDGMKKNGPLVERARAVLSTDLLSPLLGATLFPDALQRVIPDPIGAFDRSRALEYAVETSWRKATIGDCGRCDGERMSQDAMDMYGQSAPQDAVPNLFLNTTEAGTGQIIPYATVRVTGLATPFRSQAEVDDSNIDDVRPSPSQVERLTLQDRMTDDRIPLSTAAIVSARFPYLTPAGSIGYSGGHYVDGGYFENSGTWLLSGLVQNLIGQQLAYPVGQSPQLEAARNAVFIVIVIQSEPCTRNSIETGCDEDATAADNSWNEVLSPLRALLSTRDKRADYSSDSLGAVTALIEQFSNKSTKNQVSGSDISCDYPVCAVTLRFRNHTRTDIPLSWVLSSAARQSMDDAVDGMEAADVRSGPPPASVTSLDDPKDLNRVLGSYRRVLCLLAARTDEQGCVPSPKIAP